MVDYGGNFQISHDKSLSERLYVMADTTQAGPSEPERGGAILVDQLTLFQSGANWAHHIITGPQIVRPIYGPAKVMDFIDHNWAKSFGKSHLKFYTNLISRNIFGLFAL